jgi:ABC-2 type transport system ATP-binding protein
VIEIQNVTKAFGENVAVKDISIKIKKGEVFGFLGPNGAGKTTTMKMILGLLRPDSGKIHLFHEPVGTLSARRRIGFLPEFAHFYQHLTGYEFLSLIGEIFHLSKEIIEKRCYQLLKLVNLPPESHHRHIGTYSKGMQQRIGMAQALMNDPEILFLDEPMSGLDPVGRWELKDIMTMLKEQGKTLFFNSHILADVEEICDRVGMIHHGKIMLDGPVKEIVSHGKNLEEVFVETLGYKPLSSAKTRRSFNNEKRKNTNKISGEGGTKKKHS